MKTNFKGFKYLQCWIKARDLRRKISFITKSFPAEERFMLRKQLVNSSRSITNNIAEGYGRYSYSDMRHFFIQARGSLAETVDHISIALDENYITNEIHDQLEGDCEFVLKLINGFIIYIDTQKIKKTSSDQSQTLSPKPKALNTNSNL